MAAASRSGREASGGFGDSGGEVFIAASPILIGRLHIAPIVHDFVAAYPQVSVRLVLSDSVIDMVEANVDVAVRIGRLHGSDLIARTAGHIRRVLCAGPSYLAAAGVPATP